MRYELRRLLKNTIKRSSASALLFSGGLDTSILLYLVSRYRNVECFTVGMHKSSDVKHSKFLATKLNVQHHIRYINVDELLGAIPKLVKTLRTFAPMELRNSVVILIALSEVKSRGIDTVMTGDGADELFAGYSYLWDKSEDELQKYTRHLAEVMRFPAHELGEKLGIRVESPYLSSRMVEFALKIGKGLKIHKKNGKTYGKWILRKAFENYLPYKIVWRDKTAIEFGSGATRMGTIISARISDKEFNEKKDRYRETDGVKLRNKEQLWYYEIYRELVVPRRKSKGKSCPYCNSTLPAETNKYCEVCGAYPV